MKSVRDIVLKKGTVKLFFICFFLLGSEAGYSMTSVKNWVNQIRPGTFEITDASADLKKKEIRTFSAAEVKVLTELAKREEELKRKEAAHQQRAAELKSLSQQIEQKLDQIRKLTDEFEIKRQSRKKMDERDISKMVRLYETMDPEKTTAFLNEMDRVTAVHIIMRMNPRKASAVLELLDPKVVVDITERVTRYKADRKLINGR